VVRHTEPHPPWSGTARSRMRWSQPAGGAVVRHCGDQAELSTCSTAARGAPQQAGPLCGTPALTSTPAPPATPGTGSPPPRMPSPPGSRTAPRPATAARPRLAGPARDLAHHLRRPRDPQHRMDFSHHCEGRASRASWVSIVSGPRAASPSRERGEGEGRAAGLTAEKGSPRLVHRLRGRLMSVDSTPTPHCTHDPYGGPYGAWGAEVSGKKQAIRIISRGAKRPYGSWQQ